MIGERTTPTTPKESAVDAHWTLGDSQKAEKRLELALEAGRMGTWEWDLSTGRVTWSPALERAHGIPEGSFGGGFEEYQQDIHPEDRERVLSTISSTLEQRRDHHLEYRIIRPDGAVRWLEAFGQVHCDGEGRPTAMLGVCTDITERKAAETALRESEAWFSTTLASVGDAVIATDAEGRVRYMNAVSEELMKCSLAEARERPLVEVFRILNEQTREPVESPVDKVLREGVIVGLANHTILVRPNGTEIAIDDSAAPIRSANGDVVGVVMVFRDVTEKRLEEARQTFIREATRLLASTLDPERAVAMIAELAVPEIADWCGIDVVDDDGTIRRLAVAHVDPEKVKLAHELHLRYPPDPNAAHGAYHVVRTGISELVEEIPDELLVASARDAEHLAIARKLGLKSYMVVPIRTAEKTFGAVSFVIAEAKRRLGKDDLRLAEQLCDCAAIAIRNAHLYREAQEARRHAEEASSRATATAERMQVLAEASKVFAEKSIDVDELTSAVATLVGTRLGDSCNLLLIASDGCTLVPKALHDIEPDAVVFLSKLLDASPLRLGEGIAGQIAQSGQSVHVPVVARDSFVSSMKPEHRPWLDRFPFHSVVSVPLCARGVVIGVLTAFRHRTKQSYSVEDKQLLEALADRAGLAIDNARLLEAERAAHGSAESAHSETAMLYRLADATNRAATLGEVFDAALDTIRGALGVERAAILLYDEEQVMRFGAWRGLSETYRAAVEGHSPWKPDETKPQAIFVEDVTQSSDLAPYLPVLRAEGVRSLAFVPLVYEARLLGKFMLYSELPKRFAERELGIAGSIADQLASAVGRRKAAEHRETLIAQLTETVRMNELFAAILGHDLRNPLGAILTSAELVHMRSTDENVRRPIGRILSSGGRMTRMIEQLLDFTRARVGGGLGLERQTMDLAPLCKQILGELEDAKAEGAFQIEVVGDTHGAWDPDRIAQVLSNLAGNAYQHRLTSTPVMVQVDGSEREHVLLRVANKGEIAPDVLPVLFDPFRGTQQRRDGAHGLGLGLFITQQIVLTHRGEISVSSANGETTFVVRLPRAG